MRPTIVLISLLYDTYISSLYK